MTRLMQPLIVTLVANVVHGYFWYKDKEYQVPQAHNNQPPSQATTQLFGP